MDGLRNEENAVVRSTKTHIGDFCVFKRDHFFHYTSSSGNDVDTVGPVACHV